MALPPTVASGGRVSLSTSQQTEWVCQSGLRLDCTACLALKFLDRSEAVRVDQCCPSTCSLCHRQPELINAHSLRPACTVSQHICPPLALFHSYSHTTNTQTQGFAKTMKTLALDDVFPDMSPRIYHLRVDPLQPNRVWFTTRCAFNVSWWLRLRLQCSTSCGRPVGASLTVAGCLPDSLASFQLSCAALLVHPTTCAMQEA